MNSDSKNLLINRLKNYIKIGLNLKKNKLKIREPIWLSKSIGIASKRAFADLEIEITYKDKAGNRVYPATYKIRKYV